MSLFCGALYYGDDTVSQCVYLTFTSCLPHNCVTLLLCACRQLCQHDRVAVCTHEIVRDFDGVFVVMTFYDCFKQ